MSNKRLSFGGARGRFGYIHDVDLYNQPPDVIMKPNVPAPSLLAVTVLLVACGKKELDLSAPAPIQKDAASAAVVAKALEDVDAIVEAAQEEVAETIEAAPEKVGAMQAEAVAAVESEVAEVQAEAMEDVSAVIDDVEQELTAAATVS